MRFLYIYISLIIGLMPSAKADMMDMADPEVVANATQAIERYFGIVHDDIPLSDVLMLKPLTMANRHPSDKLNPYSDLAKRTGQVDLRQDIPFKGYMSKIDSYEPTGEFLRLLNAGLLGQGGQGGQGGRVLVLKTGEISSDARLVLAMSRVPSVVKDIYEPDTNFMSSKTPVRSVSRAFDVRMDALLVPKIPSVANGFYAPSDKVARTH